MFEQTEEFLSVIRSVSDRLGFEKSLTLGTVFFFLTVGFKLELKSLYFETDDIERLYMMCSFEKAWRPKKLSPWCAAFSEEDLEVLVSD